MDDDDALDASLTPAQAEWMRQLNAEAVRRKLPGWPIPDIEVSASCWLIDFDAGMTPSDALTKHTRPAS